MSEKEYKYFVPKDVEATPSSRGKYEETEEDLKNLKKALNIGPDSSDEELEKFLEVRKGLEKEKEEDTIFELASAGFESTVRLAKSNPAMWIPIFMQNKENVLDVLNEHISQLRKFKSCLEKENYDYLAELIRNANKIQKIIK